MLIVSVVPGNLKSIILFIWYFLEYLIGLFRYKNHSKAYINISFERGRVYGIVGENGAGKTTLFNCISGLEPYEGIISCNYGVLKKVEPDKIILEIRTEIEFIPLIVSGVVKAMRRDGKGNGIFLHYLTPSQTSAIALTFSLENKKSEIRLKAESTVSYIAVPAKTVNSWFIKYNSWRSFYLKLNSKQTSFLIEKINDIAFESLEYRLLKYLEQTNTKLADSTEFQKK